MDNRYPFTNTPLRYPYNALEPYIDEKTMILHHDRHLQAYIDKLNSLMSDCKQIQRLSLHEILKNSCRIPEEKRRDVLNNAGGVYNHRFYFNGMSPDCRGLERGILHRKMSESFTSFENFKNEFTAAAMSVFGSGYAWLVYDGKKLKFITTKNQDTPLCRGFIPILNIDVWEHAYYLKHYNDRKSYIDDFIKVVNWATAEKRLCNQKSF